MIPAKHDAYEVARRKTLRWMNSKKEKEDAAEDVADEDNHAGAADNPLCVIHFRC